MYPMKGSKFCKLSFIRLDCPIPWGRRLSKESLFLWCVRAAYPIAIGDTAIVIAASICARPCTTTAASTGHSFAASSVDNLALTATGPAPQSDSEYPDPSRPSDSARTGSLLAGCPAP